jgi:hypothetical protein
MLKGQHTIMNIDPSTVPGQPSQGDPTTNPQPNVGNPASHGDLGNTSLEELRRQLAESQRKLAEFERDNKKYRTERKQQEEAAALAQQKQLEEQGQFKALAEQHESRVKELEPVAQRYHDLSLQVALQIEAQIKDWPQEIKAFDPGNDAPVEARLAWIEKSKPIIEKLQATAVRPGNGPNPKPGAPTSEDQRNTYLDKLRRSGKYGA